MQLSADPYTHGELATEAQKYVWKGAIPLQIHLHASEVTILPPPPPVLILAPRIGYLPLLIPQLRPLFSETLPPGSDTAWFEYKGLPLKWHIPTGVLFDLLCPEPERPWNLTVHFRGYPRNILTPCAGDDCLKWSFINSLKEAAYIINGNCKNVMNLPQNDQSELWRSVVDGDLGTYKNVSSKHKLGTSKSHHGVCQAAQNNIDEEKTRHVRNRIPVRLYVWCINKDANIDFDDPLLETHVNCWDEIFYINRVVEIYGETDCFTFYDALRTLLQEIVGPESGTDLLKGSEVGNGGEASCKTEDDMGKCGKHSNAEVKLVRVQGIELKPEIPFDWVVKNLTHPEYFLHICAYVKVPEDSKA